MLARARADSPDYPPRSRPTSADSPDYPPPAASGKIKKRLGANRPQASGLKGPAPYPTPAGKQPGDDQQDRRADVGHDHRADDRVTRDHDAEVEKAGEHDAAEQGSDDAHDDGPEETKAVAERKVARENTGHQADQCPDQNLVQVEGDWRAIDRDDHYSSRPPLQT